MTEIIEGGCACGQVRFKARGAPKRVGLCHCLICRKAHAAAFVPFAVFDADEVTVEGGLKSWRGSSGYDRAFCPNCGSRVIGRNGDEVELSLGSFDHESTLTPQYESWSSHREHWLAPLSVPQFNADRGADTAQ